MGVATGYRVAGLSTLRGACSKLRQQRNLSAEFYTAGTSLTLPSNILVPGNSYFMDISAISNPAFDITQSPFRVSIPFGQADALSGLLTP